MLRSPRLRPRADRPPSTPLTRRRFLAGALAAGAAVSGFPATRSIPPSAAQTAPCASPSASPAASPVASPRVGTPAPIVVAMTSRLRFDPPDLTIQVGTTVTRVNRSPIPHTTTDDPTKNPVAQIFPQYAELPPCAVRWDSGLLNPGQSFSHTFTVPGRYHYFCIPHVLSGMRGSVSVEG